MWLGWRAAQQLFGIAVAGRVRVRTCAGARALLGCLNQLDEAT